MDRIKAIHVITDKNIGGAGSWLLNFLKYHDRERFEIKVILPEDSLLKPRVEDLGIDIINIGLMEERSYERKAVSRFAEVFKREAPDLVHTHASLSARLGAKKAGVPAILNTKHCMEAREGFIMRFIKRKIANKSGSMVVAVSEAVGESLNAEGIGREGIRVIYSGVEPFRKLEDKERTAFRENLGIAPGDFVAGIAARLEPVKDHDTFIKAAAILVKKAPDIKFLVMGTGSLELALKARAAELGLLDKVIFAGFIHDMERAMNALDLNVITSREEALCLSIIEGMTAGVPALGSDTCGIPEAIENGVTGELFPPGDAEALAEKILKLYGDRGLLAWYSENAKKMAAEKFSPIKMCREIEALYMELLHRREKI